MKFVLITALTAATAFGWTGSTSAREHAALGYERALSDSLNLRIEAGFNYYNQSLSQIHSHIGLLVKF